VPTIASRIIKVGTAHPTEENTMSDLLSRPIDRRQAAGLSLFALGCFSLSLDPADANQPQPKPEVKTIGFTYKPRKAEDSLNAALTKDGGVIFGVTSKSGIGGAEIILTQGDWPQKLSLHFLGFKDYLESFNIGNGKVMLSAALRDRPKTTWYFDQAGKPVNEKDRAVYTMTIEVNEKERRIEVTLPPNLCTKETKSLKVEWIDAFRQ
jgi:hypothetical protein